MNKKENRFLVRIEKRFILKKEKKRSTTEKEKYFYSFFNNINMHNEFYINLFIY